MKRPIRVGILAYGFSLGGGETWTVSMACGLQNDRVRVVGIWVLTGNPYFGNFTRLPQNVHVLYGMGTLKGFAELCDVIISWGVSLKELDGLTTTSIIVNQGSTELLRSQLAESMDRTPYGVGVSELSASIFPDPSKITVIPNWAIESRCVPKIPRHAMRESWCVGNDDVCVGYIGRIAPEKNSFATALGCRHLGQRYVPVYYGPNFLPGRDVVQEIKALAPRAIVRGPIEQVGDIYNALDCFVLASPSEGCSLALCEAWYCGVPAVVTPVGSVNEFQRKHGQMAVVVPVDPTPEQIADGILKAIDPQNAAVVHRAQVAVCENYTESILIKKWTDYIVSVYSRSKKQWDAECLPPS